MDIYSKLKPNQTQTHYVTVGRIATLTALVVALFTAYPLLGKSEQAFQFIQEFSGFFSPGIVVIFLLGMFYKRTTSLGALAAALGSAGFSFALKMLMPEVPFMDRIGIVFLLCLASAIIISHLDKPSDHDFSVSLDEVSFETDKGFNIAGIGCVLILIALYATWW